MNRVMTVLMMSALGILVTGAAYAAPGPPAVPEPGSLAMLGGCGVAGAAFFLWNKMRRK